MFGDDYFEIPDSFPLCRYRIKRTWHKPPDQVGVVEVEKCKLIIVIHQSVRLTMDQIKGVFVQYYKKNPL